MRNHTLFAACATFALAAFCTACDDVDEDERFIVVGTESFPLTPDTLRIVAEDIDFEIIREHRILVEDYTGWSCTNCPDMTAFLKSAISDNYPAVIVGLHPASNSLSTTAPVLPFQLSSTLADTYGNYFGGDAASMALPSIILDRIRVDGVWLMSGYTESVRTTAGALALDLFRSYNVDSTRTLVSLGLHVEAEGDVRHVSLLAVADEALDRNLKAQLWVIENGIVGFQSGKTFDANYTHNHVLREAINGDWGESVTLAPASDGADYRAIVRADWNAAGKAWVIANCEVVAFIYDDDTKEVLNTVKAAL